jgi:hypothetical protein
MEDDNLHKKQENLRKNLKTSILIRVEDMYIVFSPHNRDITRGGKVV